MYPNLSGFQDLFLPHHVHKQKHTVSSNICFPYGFKTLNKL